MTPEEPERSASGGQAPDDGTNGLPGIEGYEEAVEIGRGGFAVVFRAWQPAFKRHVAIKLISVLQDRTTIERFERECLAVGALSGHPNIVTVYDLGRSADGRPFIVMEFLSGGSLADRLERGRPMSWQRAVATGVKLAGALEAAHRATVLHRDVKPANVLISRFDEPKLADFGIARIQGRTDTRSGAITASFAHAAPEVISGERPVVQSDVYSLGSTLYELVAGRAPFVRAEDESLLPMLARIVSEPPPDLRAVGVPPEVCEVIESALAKDPAARPATAVGLGQQLRAVQARLGGGVTPLPLEGEGEEGSDLPSPPAGITRPSEPTTNDTITVSSARLPPPDATPNQHLANGDPETRTEPPRVPAPPLVPPPGDTRRPGQRRRKLAIFVAVPLVLIVAAVAVFARPSSDTSSLKSTAGRKTRSAPRVIFADHFTPPSDGWKEDDTADASHHYVGGAWEIKAKQPNMAAFSETADQGFSRRLDKLGDVAVEVTTTRTSLENGWFGVTCRHHPENGSFYFAVMSVIDGNGSFSIAKKGLPNEPETLSTRITATNAGPSHRIRLACSGASGKPVKLEMSVDGKTVLTGQDNDTPLPAGAVGLTVVPMRDEPPGVTVRFDDFTVLSLA